MATNPILEISSLNFTYGQTDGKVLENVSLTVRPGEIYGLLGASGCGKTTLLRLILGQIPPQSGSIRLFGSKIDYRHRPPPLDIGYMPQDIVLYQEFTIEEILRYFGQLYGMLPEMIAKRRRHLLRLLDLTNGSKPISGLSGGQKRRVSLAVALLHRPRLLILDEPTVGVDPLLREIIWNYLRRLTTGWTSVILTTHYIEEARNSDVIGFLRHGRMLVQSPPESLMKKFHTKNMEEIFLKLCHQNDQWEKKRKELSSGIDENFLPVSGLVESVTALVLSSTGDLPSSPPPSNGKIIEPKISITNPDRKKWKSCSNHLICWPHLSTLMEKNFRQVRRNISLLLFFIFLPAIEMALIMLCIGRDIRNIPIAMHNGEYPNTDLSQTFLDSIEPEAFIIHRYDEPDDAYEAVRNGQASAFIRFSKNFSTALRSRYLSFGFIDDDDDQSFGKIWNDSSVLVQLDMSNQLIGLQIQRQLLAAFLTFAQRLAGSMGLGNHTFRPPISFGPPIYGIQTSAVVETFIAPGALIMIAFFATTIVTCHLLIHEIRHRLIERALIAGATGTEFLFGHIAIQTSILAIQLTLVLITAFRWFQMPYLGSLPLAIVLISLQGLCGLMFGLMLSATCPDEIYATTLAIGTFFPSVIIGGIFWPVQSMPPILQYLSQCMPSTQSIDALRSILLRRWDIRHRNIAAAFIISTIWLAIFLLFALRCFTKRI